MKIWIVIAVLGIVLIVALFWNNKAKAATGTASGAGAGATDPLVNAVSGMLGAAVPTSSDCRQDCDKLCGSLGLFDGRGQCKDDCKSACIAGKPYKTMFP